MVERAQALLNEEGRPLAGSRVLGIGITFKPGVEDTRRSPALRVLEELARRGAKVAHHDPLVPWATLAGSRTRSVRLTRPIEADLVIVFLPQRVVDREFLANEARLVLDCCNALQGLRESSRARIQPLWGSGGVCSSTTRSEGSSSSLPPPARRTPVDGPGVDPPRLGTTP